MKKSKGILVIIGLVLVLCVLYFVNQNTSTLKSISGGGNLVAAAAGAGACTIDSFSLIPSKTTNGNYIIATGSTGVTDAARAFFKIYSANCSIEISELKFEIDRPGTISSLRMGSTVMTPVSIGGKSIVQFTGLKIPEVLGALNDVGVAISYNSAGVSFQSGDTSKIKLSYMKFKDILTGTTYTFCDSGCTIKNTFTDNVSPDIILVGAFPNVDAFDLSSKKLTVGAVGYTHVARVSLSPSPVGGSVLVYRLPIDIDSIKGVVTTNNFQVVDQNLNYISTTPHLVIGPTSIKGYLEFTKPLVVNNYIYLNIYLSVTSIKPAGPAKSPATASIHVLMDKTADFPWKDIVGNSSIIMGMNTSLYPQIKLPQFGYNRNYTITN